MWIWAEETGLPGRTLTLLLSSLPDTLVALMVGLHRLRVMPWSHWLSYLLPLGMFMTGLPLWSPVSLHPGSLLRRTERVIRVARLDGGARTGQNYRQRGITISTRGDPAMSRTGEAGQEAGLPGQDRDGAGHTGSLTVPVRVRWLALCRTAAQLERERAWSQAGRQWYEAMGLAQGEVDIAWCESRYLWCRRCVNEQGIQEMRREDDKPLR